MATIHNMTMTFQAWYALGSVWVTVADVVALLVVSHASSGVIEESRLG